MITPEIEEKKRERRETKLFYYLSVHLICIIYMGTTMVSLKFHGVLFHAFNQEHWVFLSYFVNLCLLLYQCLWGSQPELCHNHELHQIIHSNMRIKAIWRFVCRKKGLRTTCWLGVRPLNSLFPCCPFNFYDMNLLNLAPN